MLHCLKQTVAGREFIVSWQGVETGGGLALVSQPGASASLGGCYKNRPAAKHPQMA